MSTQSTTKHIPVLIQDALHGLGRRVAVASNSPQVRIFALADLGCEGVLEGQHTETVLSLDASPDGRWLLTGAKDRAVCLWRVDPCPADDTEAEGAEGAGSRMLATACVARRSLRCWQRTCRSSTRARTVSRCVAASSASTCSSCSRHS